MNKHLTGSLMILTIMIFGLFLFEARGENSSKNAAKKLDQRRAESLLARTGLSKNPDRMMHAFLLKKINEKKELWIQEYEKVKTPEQITLRQERQREYFRKQLGTLWSKTPLQPQIAGSFQTDGCKIEKVVFQSIPGFYVTANFYLPNSEKYKAPYPAVLSLMGHNVEGKAAGRGILFCLSAARQGLAVLAIDPIDQGERFQYLNKKGKPVLTTCPAHNVIGSGSILLGRNTATFEIVDMIRSLDYLDSRSEVIHGAYGAAGASGGGTQTSYIMAIDDRIKAAAPACYICGLFGKLLYNMGPQDAEQNIFGQLEFGIDHADYAMMRAPSPVLLATATRDMFNIEDAWTTFRYAKRLYSRMSFAENIDLIETDFIHQYSLELREATVRWLLRHLAKRDENVFESLPEKIPTEKDLLCLDTPGIMSLPNARTTYDLNRDLNGQLAKKRKDLWQKITPEQASDLIAQTAGIRAYQNLEPAHRADNTESETDFVLETEKGIYLPVRSNITKAIIGNSLKVTDKKNNKNENVKIAKAPSKNNSVDRLVIFISDQGRFSLKANEMFKNDHQRLAALDLCGWGETQAFNDQYYQYRWFGTDGSDYYLAYLLGRSYIGMRTESLLAAVKYLKKRYGANLKIDLIAEGYADAVALHAAIRVPNLFNSVALYNRPRNTWSELIQQSPVPIRLTDCIHGVLNYYDLDDLRDFVFNKK